MDKHIEEITIAKNKLSNGLLVAIPTETVYGLAANALNIDAIKKIFEAKNRPTFDPLIVHCSSIEQVHNYVKEFPEQAQKLAQKFWPGPLTLVLPKKDVIPDLVTAGLDTVAIRIPNHPLTLNLLESLDFPLAAPSANPFGYVSPTTAQHVQDQLGDKVSYILDGQASKVGIESSIVGFVEECPTIFRLGGLTIEQIQEVIPTVNININASSNPKAPGMLAKHYAPKVKICLVDSLEESIQGLSDFQNIGIISFQKYFDCVPKENQVVLSESGQLFEAAQNLFAGMRYLDKKDLKLIYAELLPEEDLGRAINDRLKRASV